MFIVTEYAALMGKVRFTILNLGKPPQACHIIVLMPVFSLMTRKSRVMLIFCPISTYTQINGLEMKKRKSQLLLNNRDLFVTPDNPDIGLTREVEHQIHLKPDAIPKHQRPYKLTPDKREALRHHLNELLRQGIISTVSETEDIPISSPIVLVSKRNKPKPGVEPGTPEASLSMFRFCVDFRYLNSQTQDFCYAIPSVEELTESFTHKHQIT